MKTTAFIGMLLLLCLSGCGGKERKAEEPPKAYSSIELGNRYYSTFKGGGLEYLSYPDYLGGTYHDSIGNLVFLVKGDREAAKKNVRRPLAAHLATLAKSALTPRRAFCTSAKPPPTPRRVFYNTCKVSADPSARILHICKVSAEGSAHILHVFQGLFLGVGTHFSLLRRWFIGK